MTRKLLVQLLVLGAIAYAIYRASAMVPDSWNPWAALEIEATPNLLTRYKLGRLSGNPQLCLAVLSGAQLRYQVLPDKTAEPGCSVFNAIRIEATSTHIAQPFVLSCRSAAALALWERHVLQPAAQAHFGARVARLEHFGSYACRNVYGRDMTRRSQHASAEALDIAGFVLSNRRRIRVQDWMQKGQNAGFLREIRDGACRFFDAVLGPEYNKAHHDHFHLDRGSFRACR